MSAEVCRQDPLLQLCQYGRLPRLVSRFISPRSENARYAAVGTLLWLATRSNVHASHLCLRCVEDRNGLHRYLTCSKEESDRLLPIQCPWMRGETTNAGTEMVCEACADGGGSRQLVRLLLLCRGQVPRSRGNFLFETYVGRIQSGFQKKKLRRSNITIFTSEAGRPLPRT